MDKINDYRRTKYCPELTNIHDKKKEVEKQIKEVHPRAQDMHTYVSDNSDKFNLEFMKAYNFKCAYCGVLHDLLQKDVFEIDHFLYKKTPMFIKKKDAGYVENLVLACRYCNRNKGSFEIKDEQYNQLHPDGEGIKKSFIRDKQYYIRINNSSNVNKSIVEFYEKLKLGSELHRLDYLLMNIIGMKREHSNDEKLCVGLGQILDILRAKRNIM